MCLAFSTNIPPILMTTFATEVGGADGLTPEQLGRIPATIFAAMVFGILIAGPFADRAGANRIASAGSFIVMGGLGFLAMSHTFFMVLNATTLLGFGAGLLEVILSPIVAAANPNTRASTLNRLHLFYCVGAVTSVLLASFLMSVGIGWRTILLLILTIPLAAAIAFACSTMHTGRHEDTETPKSCSWMIATVFISVAFAMALAGGVEIGIAQWLPAFAELELGYDQAFSASSLAAFSVAMAAGRLILSRWIASHGTGPVLAFCCLGTLILLMVPLLSSAPALSLGACILIGFTVAPLWPTTLALASERFPGAGAMLFAVLSLSGNAGCIIMPWAIGYITEQASLSVGIASTAVCPGLLLIIYLWVHWKKRV